MNEEDRLYKFPRLDFEFEDHRKFKDFCLGVNMGRNETEMLAEDESYETLNTDKELRTIDIKEYYFQLNLGFWQLHIQLVTR